MATSKIVLFLIFVIPNQLFFVDGSAGMVYIDKESGNFMQDGNIIEEFQEAFADPDFIFIKKHEKFATDFEESDFHFDKLSQNFVQNGKIVENFDEGDAGSCRDSYNGSAIPDIHFSPNSQICRMYFTQCITNLPTTCSCVVWRENVLLSAGHCFYNTTNQCHHNMNSYIVVVAQTDIRWPFAKDYRGTGYSFFDKPFGTMKITRMMEYYSSSGLDWAAFSTDRPSSKNYFQNIIDTNSKNYVSGGYGSTLDKGSYPWYNVYKVLHRDVDDFDFIGSVVSGQSGGPVISEKNILAGVISTCNEATNKWSALMFNQNKLNQLNMYISTQPIQIALCQLIGDVNFESFLVDDIGVRVETVSLYQPFQLMTTIVNVGLYQCENIVIDVYISQSFSITNAVKIATIYNIGNILPAMNRPITTQLMITDHGLINDDWHVIIDIKTRSPQYNDNDSEYIISKLAIISNID